MSDEKKIESYKIITVMQDEVNKTTINVLSSDKLVIVVKKNKVNISQ